MIIKFRYLCNARQVRLVLFRRNEILNHYSIMVKKRLNAGEETDSEDSECTA